MNLYLAAAFHRKPEMLIAKALCEEAGHIITSRWITESSDDPMDDPILGAQTDLQDIHRSDGLILFSDGPRGASIVGGGRLVEFGYALAFTPFIAVVGPIENPFQLLPNMHHFDTLQELLQVFNDRT